MPYSEQLALSVDLSEDVLLFSHLCKKAPLQTIKNCLIWGGSQTTLDASCLNALEELFLDIPTDCLNIIKDYISDFPRKRLDTGGDYRGSMPLHSAAKKGRIDVVKVLLSRGIHVNSINIYGETALYLAAEAGRTEMVEFLISKGAMDISDELVHFFDKPLYAIIAASKGGHLDTVISLLKLTNPSNMFRVSVNGKPAFEFGSALWNAVRYGHIRITRYLLQNGFRPIEWTMLGTVFLAAAEYGSVQQMKVLINSDLVNSSHYLNYANSEGVTPLISAAYYNNTPLVRYLIKCKANLLETNTSGITAYAWACYNGNINMMKVLEDAGGDDLHLRRWNGLFSAVRNNKFNAVKHILKRARINITLDKSGNGVLHTANTPKMVRLLIKCGANINQNNSYFETPLYLAVRYGNSLLVKELLKYKPYISRRSDTGLTAPMLCIHRMAETYDDMNEIYNYIFSLLLTHIDTRLRPKTLQYGKVNIIEYSLLHKQYHIFFMLMEKAKYINTRSPYKGFNLLHFAAASPCGVVEYLLEKGANVNATCSLGRTPLDYALYNKNTDIIEILLEYGADTDIYIKGSPLLQYTISNFASDSSLYPLINMFIMKGADIHAVNEYTGATCLTESAEIGDLTLVRYCLLRGLDVNVQTHNGYTALMLAAKGGYVECVEELLLTADVFLKKKDGKNAMLLATEMDHFSIVDILSHKMKIFR
jgi:ankyrin repeat protein